MNEKAEIENMNGRERARQKCTWMVLIMFHPTWTWLTLRMVAVSIPLWVELALLIQPAIDTRGCFRFSIYVMTYDVDPAYFDNTQNCGQFRRPFGNQ